MALAKTSEFPAPKAQGARFIAVAVKYIDWNTTPTSFRTAAYANEEYFHVIRGNLADRISSTWSSLACVPTAWAASARSRSVFDSEVVMRLRLCSRGWW